MPRTAGVIQAEIDQIKVANPNWTTNAGIIALITELNKEKNQLSGIVEHQPMLPLYSWQFWVAYSVFVILVVAVYLYMLLTIKDRNPIWQLRLKCFGFIGLFFLIINTFKYDEEFLSRLECGVCIGWCVIFCVTLAYCGPISREKRNLAFNTIMEFLTIGGLALIKSPLTFPIYMCLKASISLIIYIVEIIDIRRMGVETIDLRPCHSMIQVGDVPVHATTSPLPQPGVAAQPEVIPRGQLVSQCHHDVTIGTRALYNTCIGISISQFNDAILQVLSGCGKCHDWSAVAACILSQHRFLTYSIVSHARWGSWLLMFNVMMYKYWGIETLGRPLCDIDFICSLGFDMYNIFTFESTLAKSNVIVASIHSEYKVFALIVAVHLFHKYASMSWAPNGLLLYNGVSILCAVIVWLVSKI